MLNRKLKFEGLEVGTKVRAFDFKPMSDRPDSFVDGFITEVHRDVLAGGPGYAAYLIAVTDDSVFEKNARTEIWAPMETSFMEYDERITVLEESNMV